MSAKHTHLGMIQGIVNRLSSNSFLLKGWTVLLVSVLFALSAKDKNVWFVFLSFFPLISFWLLDGYFLWQERLFRALYDHVRLLDEDKIDYSMNVNMVNRKDITWIRSCFSKTILSFHLVIFLSIVIIIIATCKTGV